MAYNERFRAGMDQHRTPTTLNQTFRRDEPREPERQELDSRKPISPPKVRRSSDNYRPDYSDPRSRVSSGSYRHETAPSLQYSPPGGSYLDSPQSTSHDFTRPESSHSRNSLPRPRYANRTWIRPRDETKSRNEVIPDTQVSNYRTQEPAAPFPLFPPTSRQDRDEASSVSGMTNPSETSLSRRHKCHVCSKPASSDLEVLFECSTCPRRYHKGCHTAPIPMHEYKAEKWKCGRCKRKRVSVTDELPKKKARIEEKISTNTAENPTPTLANDRSVQMRVDKKEVDLGFTPNITKNKLQPPRPAVITGPAHEIEKRATPESMIGIQALQFHELDALVDESFNIPVATDSDQTDKAKKRLTLQRKKLTKPNNPLPRPNSDRLSVDELDQQQDSSVLEVPESPVETRSAGISSTKNDNSMKPAVKTSENASVSAQASPATEKRNQARRTMTAFCKCKKYKVVRNRNLCAICLKAEGKSKGVPKTDDSKLSMADIEGEEVLSANKDPTNSSTESLNIHPPEAPEIRSLEEAAETIIVAMEESPFDQRLSGDPDPQNSIVENAQNEEPDIPPRVSSTDGTEARIQRIADPVEISEESELVSSLSDEESQDEGGNEKDAIEDANEDAEDEDDKDDEGNDEIDDSPRRSVKKEGTGKATRKRRKSVTDSDGTGKLPKGTYTALIRLALRDANDYRLQTQGVVQWIMDNVNHRKWPIKRAVWTSRISATLSQHTDQKGKALWTKHEWQEGESDEFRQGSWYRLQPRIARRHDPWHETLRDPNYDYELQPNEVEEPAQIVRSRIVTLTVRPERLRMEVNQDNELSASEQTAAPQDTSISELADGPDLSENPILATESNVRDNEQQKDPENHATSESARSEALELDFYCRQEKLNTMAPNFGNSNETFSPPKVQQHSPREVPAVKSLYRARPEYRPENCMDQTARAAKVAEIKKRPTRKQLCSKSPMYSTFGIMEEFTQLFVPSFGMDRFSMLNEEHLRKLPTLPDYVERVGTFAEMFGLPSNPIPIMYNKELAYRDGTTDEYGKLPRAKVIYKTGPLPPS